MYSFGQDQGGRRSESAVSDQSATCDRGLSHAVCVLLALTFLPGVFVGHGREIGVARRH